MEETLKLFMLLGDQYVRFAAFLVVVYSAYVLYRKRIVGSSDLFFGCLAVLLGEAVKVASFTGIGPGQFWLPSMAATSLGYCFAAYGFTKLVKAAVNANESEPNPQFVPTPGTTRYVSCGFRGRRSTAVR